MNRSKFFEQGIAAISLTPDLILQSLGSSSLNNSPSAVGGVSVGGGVVVGGGGCGGGGGPCVDVDGGGGGPCVDDPCSDDPCVDGGQSPSPGSQLSVAPSDAGHFAPDPTAPVVTV